MRKVSYLAFCPVIACVCAFAHAADKKADDGFVPLFNGTNLDGWSGDPELWRVENGEIVGSTEKKTLKQNSFLSTKKSYSDFVLKAKVKLRNHNSGIQFRSEQRPDYVVAGYQADVAEQTYFGMLYEERGRGIMPYWNAMTEEQRKAVPAAAKMGDWNEYEITCEGDHVVMKLNGKVTCDIHDPAGAKSGIIALQLHAGPPMEARFKDIAIKELKPHYKPNAGADTPKPSALLMPDSEQRNERLALKGQPFRVPEGFTVEQVASHEITGSIINMSFDRLGRPFLALEGKGLFFLDGRKEDGSYERMRPFYEAVTNCMGLYFAAPGDLLAHGQGPNGPALYRITDTDLDDEADLLQLAMKSQGGIGEHGPHAIVRGPDGWFYVMYGNHAHPMQKAGDDSPSRGLQEDHLLPRYVDPRGHATKIRAPGGTIVRLDPKLRRLEQVVGGFRNAYDFSIDASGELWTYDSDMEWDFGLPWYRPTRVMHAVPGGDYGWRTGSSKMPAYYPDTLPGTFSIGRGSPVGMCAYEHTAYPPRYRGGIFLADWSRGRIRFLAPEKNGATYRGDAVDFVVGEPLNVTDVDVGPDGCLYFSVGGRGTHGGVYRVRYGKASAEPKAPASIDGLLSYPMPGSAWAIAAFEKSRGDLGAAWKDGLAAAANDAARAGAQRARAMELLQVHGPRQSTEALCALAKDANADVRAMAVLQLGTRDFGAAGATLAACLDDKDAAVARRASEALLRAGIEHVPDGGDDAVIAKLWQLLDHPDQFVRYSARITLQRTPPAAWRERVLKDDVAHRAHGAIEGLLALIYTAKSPEDSDAIFAKLQTIARAKLDDAQLLTWLRVAELAFLRDQRENADRGGFGGDVAPMLLARFPGKNLNVNREIQVLLAHMQRPEAIAPILAYLTPDKAQEEQAHTVYCLRAMQKGWTPEQRTQLVQWFDIGRELPGGASMEGFINNLWDDTLKLLPEGELKLAQKRKADALEEREKKALALMAAAPEPETPAVGPDGKPAAKPKKNIELAQMSFDELSQYLEFDPGAYGGDVARGKQVFVQSKCASCHVFGTVGKGGGPDLSTVTARFRRRDILEAIMYPSKVISDQYIGVEVDLDDFSTETGMIVSEDDKHMTMINVNGQRIEIEKSQIQARRAATKSIMPEGLLNTMSMGDLISLVNFLERGGDI